MIGSALGGVSVNTEVWPTKLKAVAAEFWPAAATNSSQCTEIIRKLEGVSGCLTASQGAVVFEKCENNKVPVGGVLWMRPDRITHRLQYAVGMV